MTTATATRKGFLTAAARGPWIWIPLVVILFCAPLFMGLDRPDLDNDEAIYSFAVDRILATGDWLTPKSSPSETEAFLEKPPLKFWIVALPIRLGLLPHDQFGLRFWDAVFGSLVFLYVFAIGRRLGGPVCGLVAVLALFVHRPLVMEHGLRSNNMEAALLLAYCGGIYHFLRWRSEQDPRRQRLHAFAATLYFVLGFMTKFVAVLFMPLAIAVSLLLQREGRTRLLSGWRMWVMPALLAIVLIAPWFLYQWHQFGAVVWQTMFGEHVVTRFTASLDPGHLHPWDYYVKQMILNLRLYQTLILALAGITLILFRTLRRGWTDGVVILSWLVVPLVLMSLLTSKLYHYAYPLLPPVALAAGYGASVLAGFAWSAVSSLINIDRPYRDWVRSLPRAAIMQNVLLIIALTAVAVSLVTVSHGAFSISAGGHQLFRNSDAVRAGVIGVVALILSGRGRPAGRVVLVTLIVAAMLPLTPYHASLGALHESDRSLRDERDCLLQVNVRTSGDKTGPGVWAEGELGHTFSYYLQPLGPWQYRPSASDPTVFMSLYASSHYRPVLLSMPRYAEFTHEVSLGDTILIERAARKADMSPSDLAGAAKGVTIGVVTLGNAAVLLLPGPYAVCAARQVTGTLK